MFLFQYWIIRVEQIDNYIEFVFFRSLFRCFFSGLRHKLDGDVAEGKTIESSLRKDC